MHEVLTIIVVLEEVYEVELGDALARMITFTGDCDCENFKGKILNGGVDTQQIRDGQPLTLSARYMLEGVDKDGQQCKIFIENNGVSTDGDMKTTPYILTDSKCLSFLNGAKLEGTIEPWEKGVIIHIEGDKSTCATM